MRLILTFLILFISITSFSQDYDFKINWKKGDFRVITIEQLEKEYENDVLIHDTITYNQASARVLEENETEYTLEILYQNQALRAASELYDKLDEELQDYQDVQLIYSVDKLSAETDLVNWKEVRDFMDESFDQIMKVCEQKAPDITSYLNLIFKPLREVFNSKENIEAYLQTDIGYLTIPFCDHFEIGKTISKTEATENPFNPNMEISGTCLLTLLSVDEANKIAVIDFELVFDFSEFLEMIKDMARGMAESFGVADSLTADSIDEIDNIEMDIKHMQRITFNYDTSWITNAITTVTVLMSDPMSGVKSRSEMITMVIVK